MTIKRKLIKRDSLGRRTDRVRKRELNEMVRLHTQGLVYAEIATKLIRKPETVKRHIEAALQSRRGLPVDPTINLQQIEHIRTLQLLARTTIESLPNFLNNGYVTTAVYYNDYNTELWYNFMENLNNIFQKLINDAYWPSLAEHLGNESEKIKLMANKINTECTRIPREELSLHSNELEAIVNEASNLLSAGLAVVAWFGDTEEWENRGLKPICPFCPIKRLQTQT